MSSVHKSKLRLQQLSGSAVDVYDADGHNDSKKFSIADSSHAMADVGVLLAEYGRAIARVHGKSDFTNQSRGLISHDEGTIKIEGTSTGTQDLKLQQHDGANADGMLLTMESDGTAANSVFELLNKAGDAEDSLKLTSTAGGLTLDANADKDIVLGSGQLLFTGKKDIANAVKFEVNQGSSETMLHKVTQGTSEESIKLETTAGGIRLDANAAKFLSGSAGKVQLRGLQDAASAVELITRAGTSATIDIQNVLGTSAGAVAVQAQAGGVDVDAAAGKVADVAGGKVKLSSKDDAASAILLETNVGTAEQIKLDNKQGTAATSIDIGSFAGGVLVAGGLANADAVVFDAAAGSADGRIVSKVNGTQVFRVANQSLQATQDGVDFELGSGQEFSIGHDVGAAGYHRINSTELLMLSGSGNVGIASTQAVLQLSGSRGLGILGGGIGEEAGSTFAFSGYNDGLGALLFSDLGSAKTYKTNFGSTTVLGAINDVFSRVTSGVEPTLMQKTIASASINADVPVGIYPGDGTDSSGGGTAAFFSTGPMSEIKPQKIDVFVNGQMLMSGSLSDAQAGNVDYYVSAPGEIRFAFDLKAQDVLKVIDRT